MIVLHGTPSSTFCTTCRLALAMKGVADVTIEPFAPHSPEQDARHPWGKVPAMTHGEVHLFETLAIVAYIDEAFEGPRLQPAALPERMRMLQWVSAYCDNVPKAAFPIIIQRLIVQARGDVPDEAVLAAALALAPKALEPFEAELTGSQTLAGGMWTLADLFLLPTMNLFALTPEGKMMMADLPGLNGHLERGRAHPVLGPILQV